MAIEWTPEEVKALVDFHKKHDEKPTTPAPVDRTPCNDGDEDVDPEQPSSSVDGAYDRR